MTSNESIRARKGTSEASYVSGRFLTDLLQALERRGISGAQLIGDLPIPIAESGTASTRITVSRIEWPDFVELMKRLERAMGGAAELEAFGSAIARIKPAATLRGLAGLTSSPSLLYRAAIRWALRRAIPGIDTALSVIDENHIEIHARLQDGMCDCPQIFHFATGGARALPRILGLQDALVEADVGPSEARYHVTLPPSPTIFARARRLVRTLFSAGDVLRTLEAQQLELHTQHAALQTAHAALAVSQRRYLNFTNAAVDVLSKLDASGHITFVSPSIYELMGYTREQVTGSHFRLWVPSQYHEASEAGFQAIRMLALGGAISLQKVVLHAAGGEKIAAEVSIRSFENDDGDWRMACVLRKLTRASTRPSLNNAVVSSSPHTEKMSSSIDNSIETSAARLRASRGHPLELSLARLLEAVESYSENGDPQPANDLIHASDAMTRIVNSALVSAEADLVHLRWVETLKIIERVRQEVDSGSDDPEVKIHYRLGSMPAQIWAREDLLVVGLTHLIDDALQTASASSQIELSVLPSRDSGGYACVEFVLDMQIQSGESASAEANSNDRLAIAIATDAANAHAGELVHERHEGGSQTSRLRIPSQI